MRSMRDIFEVVFTLIFYYVVFFPVAVFFKFFIGDPLNLEIDETRGSYWTEYSQDGKQKTDFKSQFINRS